MWRLLSVLALCGLPAPCADVCSGLPTDAPKGAEFWTDSGENPPPLSFRISVKHGGPAFRITVRSRLRELSDNPVVAGDIEVARCQDGKRLQLLPVMADQPLNFGASFQAEDINFDGYLDFSVLTEFAASFGSRSYWVYDPASGRVVQNALTRELGENCLGSDWHGGCWKGNIDIDQNTREIRTHYIDGFGPCASDFDGDRYRVKDNRLILIHKEEVTDDKCKVTVSDLVGGTMRVTEIRRFEPVHPPPEAPSSPSPDAQPPNLPEPVPSLSGELLYERPLDGHQEGLFSNTGNGQQVKHVGGSQFVFPDAVDITGIRWYGYNCTPVGASPVFDISFLSDNDGLPASEPIYSQRVQPQVTETTAHAVGNPQSAAGYEGYVYTIDSLPPFSIPAGRRMWISISQAPSSCQWLWNRGSSVDSGTSVWGVSESSSRFSSWTKLEGDLAFALYGRKIGTAAH